MKQAQLLSRERRRVDVPAVSSGDQKRFLRDPERGAGG